MRNNKGFTLVEMVVVIAIIGILAAAVLAALNPSRDKAKDTRIVSGVNQARAIAETLYVGSTGTYDLPEGSVVVEDPDFGSIVTDVENANGDLTINRPTDNQSYRIYSKLNGKGYFCVNSNGDSVEDRSVGVDSPGATEPSCAVSDS